MDEMEMFPFLENSSKQTFKCPSATTFDKYLEHIDENLKGDTPIAFGLHPNAEIGFRTTQSDALFASIMDLSPATGEGDEEGQSEQHVAEAMLQDILDSFREVGYDLEDIASSLDEPGPYQNVFMQECEAMNALVHEIVRSLLELELGFKGDLQMSDPMEQLMHDLFFDRVPGPWGDLAFPSLRPLGGWLANLQDRIAQLGEWVANPMDVPAVTWLSGLFNPQSFLTAISQVTAQRNNMELDKLVIATDVLKRQVDDIDSNSRDGAYIHGLFLEGARWDMGGSILDTSKPKEMVCAMPVINCKAIMREKAETSNSFSCPTYKTQQRGPTYVFSATLRTKAKSEKWVMAGVVLVMDVI
jgi:dynein heavy chain